MLGTFHPAGLFSAPTVIGLDDQTQVLFGELVTQWVAKYPRNLERMLYLDGKNKLKDLGIALPPEVIDDLDIVMGWPEKAVYEQANRIVWDGLTDGSESSDPLELESLLRANRFRVEIQQAIVSSVTHSLAFGSTTPGNIADREPEVIMMFHSALWATGLWDTRRRCLRAGLIVNDVDSLGHPIRFTIMLPTQTVVVVKGPKVWYVEDVYPHRLNRVPMEHMPFRPSLDRPFGRSRIDRRVMSLTDRGVRNAARLEVQSELFSTIKLILKGADESMFEDTSGNKVPLWNWFMGRMNTVTKDEEGDLPEIDQVQAQSPEPHIAHWRQLAAEFSGHTGVPLGSLGISTDNPASSEQMDNVRESLIIDASNQHPVYGAGLQNLFVNTVMIRDRLTGPPAGAEKVTSKWRNPSRPSVTSQSDAMVKQISAIPWIAETEVALEELGYNEDQIKRLVGHRRRMDGKRDLEEILERARQRNILPDTPPTDEFVEPEGE